MSRLGELLVRRGQLEPAALTKAVEEQRTHGGALPATPTAVDLAAASVTISGHAGEMLGYSIVGDDVNGGQRREQCDASPGG